MATVWLNGRPWHVVRVGASSPTLIDRTGSRTVATTDPGRRIICVSEVLSGDALRHVLAHEIAHAVMVSYGLLEEIRSVSYDHIAAEEWACNLMADHAAEVIGAVTALCN